MKKHSIGFVLLLEAVVIVAVLIVMLMLMDEDYWVYRSIQYFLDLPTLIGIVLFSLPVLAASGLMKDFGNAFLVGKRPFTIAQMKRSLEAVKMIQQLVLCSSSFISLTSFIVLLYKLEDIRALGPNISVMSLSFFYMVILEAFLVPLKAHVQNWITDMMDVIDEEE